MQDEMVAELKAAGTSVQGSSGNTASSSVETALTDTFMHESRVAPEGLDDLGSTPKAAASKPVTLLKTVSYTHLTLPTIYSV